MPNHLSLCKDIVLGSVNVSVIQALAQHFYHIPLNFFINYETASLKRILSDIQEQNRITPLPVPFPIPTPTEVKTRAHSIDSLWPLFTDSDNQHHQTQQ